MLAATHALAGAIIAKSAAVPEVGYLAALLSHPLLDLFPHWDMMTRNNGHSVFFIVWSSLLDAAIGFGLGFLLFGDQLPWHILALTMFLAQLPDWLEAPYHVFRWNFPPFSTIKKIQHYWHTKLIWPWGLLPQLAVLLIAILLAR